MNVFARINERFSERLNLVRSASELKAEVERLRIDNDDLLYKNALWRDRADALAATINRLRSMSGAAAAPIDPNPALVAECAELSRQLRESERRLRDAEQRIADLVKAGLDEVLYSSRSG